MVYAGYVSAKLPPPKPTAVEAAVQAVKSVESLEVLGKLVYNAAVQPKEDKFRSIKLTNAKIKAVIVDVPGALDALRALGWVDDSEREQLVVPAGTYMKMDQFKVIEAAKDRLQKELVAAARDSKLRSGPSSTTSSSTNLAGMAPQQQQQQEQQAVSLQA